MAPQRPHPAPRDADDEVTCSSSLDPRGQSSTLELLARGAELEQVLDELARTLERRVPGVLCSILVLDEDTRCLRHGAAPSLPAAYNRAVDGLRIGPDVGSCGSAAHGRQRVVVADIATDPLWRDYRDVALAHGLRACWSQPVFSTTGTVLGTFAMYYRECREPAQDELELIEQAAHLAGVAIAHQRGRELLQQAHAELEARVEQRTLALREANRRLTQEIKERKNAEQALRLTHFAIEHSLEAAFRLGLDGRFQYVNQAACELLKYSRAELLELAVPDIDLGVPHAEWPAMSSRVKREGGVTLETTLRARDGTEIAVEILANYVAFGGREYHCAYARDIRPRKRAEAAHAALERQLRHAQKMEAVGELASGVAHEFNNLLLIIGAGVERARHSAGSDPALGEAIEMVAQAARDAEGITRALLTSVHHAAGDRTPVELGALITAVAGLLRRMLPARIELEVEVDPGEVSWVLGDAVQLRQVVLNLAINARDAMPDGGRLSFAVRPTVASDWGADCLPSNAPRSSVSVVVTDTGRGMSATQQARIFEPFYTTKTRTRGTGLGLAVVHGIVRDHDAAIHVHSTPGRGTAFTLIFPRIDAPPAGVMATASAHLPAQAGAGKRVLLAEDNLRVGGIIESSLQDAGYDVLWARDGVSAVDLYEDEHRTIDAVILDIDLPRRNGLACLERVRAQSTHCPVVLITGDPSMAPDHLDEPHTVLLPKPFDPSELPNLVFHMLQLR